MSIQVEKLEIKNRSEGEIIPEGLSVTNVNGSGAIHYRRGNRILYIRLNNTADIRFAELGINDANQD